MAEDKTTQSDKEMGDKLMKELQEKGVNIADFENTDKKTQEPPKVVPESKPPAESSSHTQPQTKTATHSEVPPKTEEKTTTETATSETIKPAETPPDTPSSTPSESSPTTDTTDLAVMAKQIDLQFQSKSSVLFTLELPKPVYYLLICLLVALGTAILGSAWFVS